MARKVRKDKDQLHVLRTGEKYDKKRDYYIYQKMENGVTLSVGAKTLRELRDKEEALNTQRVFGIDYSNISFNDLFNEYMEIKKSNVKESVYHKYLKAWENYIRDTIGKRRVKDITSAEIIKLCNMLKRDRGLKKLTIMTPYSVLNMVFDYAINSNIIYKNPCKSVMRYIPDDAKKERDALSIHQYRWIANWLDSHYKEDYNMVGILFKLGCNTGLRIGELLALTWSDIDFERGTISVTKSIGEYVGENSKRQVLTPKTKNSIGEVYISDSISKMLKEHKKEQFKRGNNRFELDGHKNFIFENSKKDLFWKNDINRRLKIASYYYNEYEKKEAELNNHEPEIISNLSSHIMRHTFCTMLINNGENPKQVQALMRHADISTTLGVYTHNSKEASREAIEKLEQSII